MAVSNRQLADEVPPKQQGDRAEDQDEHGKTHPRHAPSPGRLARYHHDRSGYHFDTKEPIMANDPAAGPPVRKSMILRLSPAMHRALARWAKDEMRSVQAQVEYVLKKALADARRR
jgi:hypothetical protein